MMRSLCVAAALAALSVPSSAQAPATSARGLAIRNARVLPISGPPIERATVLVRNGKIERVSSDIAVPPGYEVVDAAGGTLMPGAVLAYGHTGLGAGGAREERPNQFTRGGGRGRRGRGAPSPQGGAENESGELALDRLYARQEVFQELLRDGVTTIGVAPTGTGLPGQGGVVRPAGDDVAAMTVVRSAFLAIAPVNDTRTKTLIQRALDDGKRNLDRRRRRGPEQRSEGGRAEGTPPAEQKPAEKPAENPGEKPPEKPAENAPEARGGDAAQGPRGGQQQQEPDPAAEAIMQLLEGKTRAFVQIDSAAQMLHWDEVSKNHSFPTVFVARRHASQGSQGFFDVVLDHIKRRKAIVLLTPELSTIPNTEYQVNMPARLHAAGIEIGFLLADRGRALSAARTQLMELVRAGLPADVALRGITLTPARALGIDGTIGSIEPGKTANLLLWSGDPLDPLAKLQRVWLEGNEVEADPR